MSSLSDSSQRLIQDAVTEFSRATGFPLAFGGYESHGITTVTALSGTHGLTLQGLRVANRRGLGGKAMVEHRPRFTRDYMSSRQISHDYDVEIGAEDIVMLVAVPVVVDGETRAVLYGGTREKLPRTSSFLRAAAGVSHALAEEILSEDDRVQLAPAATVSNLPGPLLEELRSSHAEIRRIAAETTDPSHAHACLRSNPPRRYRPRSAPPRTTFISPHRELDVLTHAALGSTNAEIGVMLGIAESTVKSYLKTAMGKLEASTRHAAVATARSFGLIP